jgi:hypothetical protein
MVLSQSGYELETSSVTENNQNKKPAIIPSPFLLSISIRNMEPKVVEPIKAQN